nr:hypothetical protein [Nostoc sp. ZfuVER08]
MFCHCVRVASRRERSEAIAKSLGLLPFARNDILDLIMTIYLEDDVQAIKTSLGI